MADDNDRIIAVTNNLVSGGFVDTSIPGATLQTRAVWGAVIPGLMIGDSAEPSAWCLLRYRKSNLGAITVQILDSKNVEDAQILTTGVLIIVPLSVTVNHVSITPQGLHSNSMMICDVQSITTDRPGHLIEIRYLGATLTGVGAQTFAATNAPPNSIIQGTMGYVQVGIW